MTDTPKNSLIRDMLRYAVVLFVISFASGILLGATYLATKEKIASQKSLAEKKALKQVFPGQDISFEADGEVWRAKKDGNFVGLVGIGSAQGYSSELKVMVGLKSDRTINAISVIFSSETPGLGENIKAKKSPFTLAGLLAGKKPTADSATIRPWFQERFDGLKIGDVRVRHDGGKIDAISGSTVTSRALCRAVAETAEKLAAKLP